MIGIKQADGSFFPLMEEEPGRTVRITLAPARTEQENVQVDFYRGNPELKNAALAEYLGSMILQDIVSSGGGTGDLSLTLSIQESSLFATIVDTAGGLEQSLVISLDQVSNIDMPEIDEMPPVTGPDNMAAGSSFEDVRFSVSEDDQQYLSDVPDDLAPPPVQVHAPLNPLLMAGFVLFGLFVVAAGLYFIFQVLKSPAVPPLQAVLIPVTAKPLFKLLRDGFKKR